MSRDYETSEASKRGTLYPSEYRTREPRSQRGDRVAEGWTLEAPDLAIAMVNEMTTSKQHAAASANRGR